MDAGSRRAIRRSVFAVSSDAGLSPHSPIKAGNLLEASFQRFPAFLVLPGSMRKHIFNKYPVAFGGILDEDVGDGADEFTILYNGAAAHALNDAAGEF